jgi:hypothetical protein
MSTSKMDFDRLQSMTFVLDPTHQACNIRIGELRRLMDLSCDQGDITIREWRLLLDKVAVVQGQIKAR